MDISGIEPEAFRMQIERDTTTPYTHAIFIINSRTIYLSINGIFALN